MEIEIGKQIKSLRQKKGITQEELAKYLQISCQAVSKWENGTSSPDISLLPIISVYFGVAIDDLFKLPQKEQFERISNMLVNEGSISNETFLSTEKYLLNILYDDNKNYESLYLLSELYNYRAKKDHEKAARYAKEGLSYAPTMRALHVSLVEALNGVTGDGYIDNNRELIEFYTEFIEKNTNYSKAYIILIENLIADGHYDAASKVIKKARKLEDKYCYYVFEGDIELGHGNKEKAIEIWEKAIKDYPHIWQTYCCYADRLLKLEMVDKAIIYYRKSFDIQEKPRLCDGLLSLTQIYEDTGNYEKAIEIWNEVIDMYEVEYNITSGELVDEPYRNIEKLKNKIKNKSE